MTGWKTKTAGIAAILTGLGLVLKGITADVFDFDSIKQGVVAIIAGLAVLGIGHKLDKIS